MLATRLLCRFLLWSVHLLIQITEALSLIKHNLLHKLKYSSVNSAKLDDAKLVGSAVHRSLDLVRKVPKHMALVIGEEMISLRDVAHLIVWCLVMRIPHVTLYDVEGMMRKNWVQLYREILICQEKQSISSSTCKVILHPDGKESAEKNGKNGYKQHIHVYLSSCEDGRPLLVHLARKLCQEVKKGELSPSKIIPALIQQEVSGDRPDPDALLRFGKIQGVLGYQPWQLRLTEIIALPTHHNIRLSEFLDALRMYDCREQRFGK